MAVCWASAQVVVVRPLVVATWAVVSAAEAVAD
jgi:hypothetical protein